MKRLHLEYLLCARITISHLQCTAKFKVPLKYGSRLIFGSRPVSGKHGSMEGLYIDLEMNIFYLLTVGAVVT